MGDSRQIRIENFRRASIMVDEGFNRIVVYITGKEPIYYDFPDGIKTRDIDHVKSELRKHGITDPDEK